MRADLVEIVQEQVVYRELMWQMTRRDLLLRYKQTAMGIGWALFMPLINTAVFSIIFTRVAPIETDVPYPIFVYTGLIAWNFFSSALRIAVISLTSNTQLVTKIYFPREVFPLSAVIVSLTDFAVSAVVLMAMLVYYEIPLTPVAFMLPFVLLPHVMLTAGCAMLLAMGNLFFRDVKYIFEVVIVVGMFATSVLYPVEAIGGDLASLLALNPMTVIIDAYRDVLLFGRAPAAVPFLTTFAFSAAVIFSSWIAFHRAEFTFAENV
jgi:lipopolysaccharide transport system permease protein